jgi:triphosphatase
MAEVELKLAVKPHDLGRAREILSGRAGHAPAAPTTLVSVYYDTPKRGLAQRELLLRVRKHGRRYIQTVKGRASGGADLLARGEWEDAIDSERPDVAAPQGGPALQRVAKNGELRPLFKTVVRRTTIPLEPGSSTRIEAALDEGEIRALDRDAAEPISEIELELKNGSPAVLYDVALRLLEAVPLRIETRSKAERGYDLVDGARRPPVVHGQAFAIAPEMTVDAVLHGIGLSCLLPTVKNAPAALAGVPDAIHQMRVSARRLRSLLSAVKPMLSAEHYRWANDELKWLLDSLGEARNWHVVTENLLKPVQSALPLPEDLDPLLRGVERAQIGAIERAKEAIQSPRYSDSLLKLLRWFEAHGWRDQSVSEQSARLMAPIGEVAPVLIGRRYRQAIKRSKRFAKLDLAQRHKLRIALKKLRYMSEFLGALFDRRQVKAFLRALKPLQDGLGSANDIRAAHELMSRLGDGTGGAAIERAAGIVLGWHDRDLVEREPKLRKQVRRFRKAEPFW